MTDQWEELRENILQEIKPTSDDYQNFIDVIKTFQDTIKKIETDIPLMIEPVGSFAKSTYLHHDQELDLFVYYPEDMPKTGIEENFQHLINRIAIALERKGFKFTYQRGTRIYYTVTTTSGITVDLVPSRWVSKPNKKQPNATENSRFHVNLINERLTGKQKDEVRLIKQFLRTTGLYSAEKDGLSGYAVEHLIFDYNFLEFIESVAKWKQKTVIDTQNLIIDEKHTPRLSSALQEHPLVIPDRAIPDRNVSASISERKYHRLIALARLFLKSISYDWFFTPQLNRDQVNDILRFGEWIWFTTKNPQYSKARYQYTRSVLRGLSATLQNYGFTVIRSVVVTVSEGSYGGICLLTSQLPYNSVIRIGPSISDYKASERMVSQVSKSVGEKVLWLGNDYHWRYKSSPKYPNALKFIDHQFSKVEGYVDRACKIVSYNELPSSEEWWNELSKELYP